MLTVEPIWLYNLFYYFPFYSNCYQITLDLYCFRASPYYSLFMVFQISIIYKICFIMDWIIRFSFSLHCCLIYYLFINYVDHFKNSQLTLKSLEGSCSRIRPSIRITVHVRVVTFNPFPLFLFPYPTSIWVPFSHRSLSLLTSCSLAYMSISYCGIRVVRHLLMSLTKNISDRYKRTSCGYLAAV